MKGRRNGIYTVPRDFTGFCRYHWDWRYGDLPSDVNLDRMRNPPDDFMERIKRAASRESHREPKIAWDKVWHACELHGVTPAAAFCAGFGGYNSLVIRVQKWVSRAQIDFATIARKHA